MAFFINIYTDNPTAGATDGTEVSTYNAYTAPISFALNAEQNESKIITLAVRTAEGYKTNGSTTIEDDGDTNDRLKLCKAATGTFADSITFTDEITAANTIFYAQASSADTEYPTIDRSASFRIVCNIVRA